MARSSSGKWVSRAAATGGGRRTYRGQVPVNWYAILILILVVGVGSVVFARYEYQNPSSSSSTVAPTVGTTWYAGIAFDVCGTQLPSIPANAASSKAFSTNGSGVITISPKTNTQAGTNATFGKFVAGYPGMKVTQNELRIPNGTKFRTYTNGQRCAFGTPDAGKTADVVVDYWPSAFVSKAKAQRVQGDPENLRFSANQLITIGFAPAGTTLPKPNGTVVTALLQAQSGATTTTTAPSSSTTAPSSASTTTAPPTTTVPASTTTTHPSSTTTTKAK
jgi:hypothetical protein